MITRKRYAKIKTSLSLADVYDELEVARDEMYRVASELPNTGSSMEMVLDFLKSAAKSAEKVDPGLQDECSRLARKAKTHLDDYASMVRDAEDLYSDIKKLMS